MDSEPEDSAPIPHAEEIARICKHLREGIPLSVAAEAEGVSRRTIYDCIQTDSPRFQPALLAQVTRARAQGVVLLHRLARRGGKGSSTATWLLERRFWDDYGPPRKADEGGAGPSEVHITIEGGLPKREAGQASPSSSDSQEAKRRKNPLGETP